jgi:serine phosphatase RsbU (regulator of sigma subunit)
LLIDGGHGAQRISLAAQLEHHGAGLVHGGTMPQTLAELEGGHIDAVVYVVEAIDAAVLATVRSLSAYEEGHMPVILAGLGGETDTTASALDHGVFECVPRRLGAGALCAAVERAARCCRLARDNNRLSSTLALTKVELSQQIRDLDNNNGRLRNEIEQRKAAQAELEEKHGLEKRQAVLEKDLALTAAVQRYFLPRQDVFRHDDIEAASAYRPAAECSGDWIHFGAYRPGAMTVLVADVMGHGPAPAMVTAAVATAFRMSARIEPHKALVERLGDINGLIGELVGHDLCMTLSALEIDAHEGAVEWYSAGAPPLFVIPKDGQVTAHSAAGMPLGSDHFHLGHKRVPLAPGDRIFVCTDGVTELALPDGGVLRTRRLAQMLAHCRDQAMAAAVCHLLLRLDQARGDAPLRDDLALVLVGRA